MRPPAESPSSPPPRPGKADLAPAAGGTIPDVVAPGLRVLFCGINPGLYSAATWHHFARPGNRFWPTLHASGFTSRRLRPDEQDQLPALGLGITNIVARATSRADELSPAELRDGAVLLAALADRLRPQWLAVLGVSAYRVAFSRPRAVVGRQEQLVGCTAVWILPNPSGLNAHWTPVTLAEEFSRLRAASLVSS